jgi:Alkylmercury lyase
LSISKTAERLRVALYSELAATGAAPTRENLRTKTELSEEQFDEAFRELAGARHIVLNDGRLVLAHPFATESFRFSVMTKDTLYWGGCAWDSFALPSLLKNINSALVATTCPACDTPHAWVVTDQQPPPGDQVAHFLTPADRIWPDSEHACRNQMIFCSETCVDEWLERHDQRRGYILDLATLWRLARHWYEGRLDTPYERRDPIASAEYFREVGLRGPFWGLPDES